MFHLISVVQELCLSYLFLFINLSQSGNIFQVTGHAQSIKTSPVTTYKALCP